MGLTVFPLKKTAIISTTVSLIVIWYETKIPLQMQLYRCVKKSTVILNEFISGKIEKFEGTNLYGSQVLCKLLIQSPTASMERKFCATFWILSHKFRIVLPKMYCAVFQS